MAVQTLGAIARLIEEFNKLPGIGPKSAERITHHLLGVHTDQVQRLAEALLAVKEQIHPCKECFNLTEGEVCSICNDVTRDHGVLCVVEQPRDVTALERTGSFRGVYHVLGGRLAPLDNIGPEDLNLDALLARVRRGEVREVIMATNPTLEGDGTALYVRSLLDGTGVRITRLARGLPSGSVLEFANAQMLADALEGRRSLADGS